MNKITKNTGARYRCTGCGELYGYAYNFCPCCGKRCEPIGGSKSASRKGRRGSAGTPATGVALRAKVSAKKVAVPVATVAVKKAVPAKKAAPKAAAKLAAKAPAKKLAVPAKKASAKKVVAAPVAKGAVRERVTARADIEEEIRVRKKLVDDYNDSIRCVAPSQSTMLVLMRERDRIEKEIAELESKLEQFDKGNGSNPTTYHRSSLWELFREIF